MGQWKSAMETVELNSAFWKNKRVLITGHTGFKGGWASLWLHAMGARISGIALEPNTDPSFFDLCQLKPLFENHVICDIRNFENLKANLATIRPEIVLHMAAQPLVRLSYRDPLETLSTNIMGTANLLQAARDLVEVRAIINVTSDKCYHNTEQNLPFRESDPLGGHDIYSASKGAAEIVHRAFQHSFYENSACNLASVRAGNVIGGGDWSMDRLVPDYFRAKAANKPIVIRSPHATRPWQHVLEPLSGYLALAERLHDGNHSHDGGWNFGPHVDNCKSVQWVVDYLVANHGGEAVYENRDQPREAGFLSLDSTKAREQLNWQGKWDVGKALQQTALWENARIEGQDMQSFTLDQIARYLQSGV
jgi:CDP-glucose 4,6-dehydratase